MPLIPLPTNNRPLANAPAAVLNREKAPTINNAGVMAGIGQLAKAGQQAEISGRQADAFTAPDRALDAIGGAIAQAGDVPGAAAIKQREMETEVQVTRARTAMKEAQLDYEANRGNDPLQWSAKWEATIKPLKDRFLGDKTLHPAAVERIALDYDAFSRLGAKDALRDQRVAVNHEVGRAIEANLKTAIATQSKEDFDAEFKRGQEMGILHDWMRPEFERDFAEKGKELAHQARAEAFDNAQNAAATNVDAYGEAEALRRFDAGEFGGDLDARDKEKLRMDIRQMGSARSAQAVDILVNGIASGDITSAARIDEMAANNKHLPPRVVAELKERIGSYNALAAKLKRDEKDKDGVTNGTREAVRLRHEIASYNPTTDPDRLRYAQLAQEIATKADANMAGELRSDLGQKYGLAIKGELRPEAQRQISKTLSVIFDSDNGVMPWRRQEPKTFKRAADDRTFFGKPQFKAGDPVIDPETGKPKIVRDSTGNVEMQWVEDLKAKEAAVNAEALIEEKMRQWAALNPEKATNTVEINKALRSFIPAGSRAGLFLQQQQRRDEANGGPLPTGRRETLDTSLFP